jgi:hypothetical protein
MCDVTTVACKDVTAPSVDITSPGANAFAGVTLTATATARAPGGVNSVRFELRTTQGAVLNSATATTPTTGASFTATITLNNPALTDGPAILVAIESFPAGTKESLPIAVRIDLTPPVIDSVGTVSPAWLGPGALTATVTVGATDSGSGVKALTLTLSGVSHAPYTATPGSSNTYVFSVPAADLNVADNTRGSVNFRIDATDNVGNAASSSGQSWQVLRVDRVKPSVSPVADSSWYSRTGGILTVSATITKDPLGSPLVTTGTTRPLMMAGVSGPFFGTFISGTTWQFLLDPTLALAGAEAALNFTITTVDAAGNVGSQPGFRNVDDAAPVVTNLSVTRPGLPGGTGVVQYPLTIANTGYNGLRFIYRDIVRIQGTIQDQGAGIAVVPATPTPALRLDGIAVGSTTKGSAGPGLAVAIASCTDGQSSCTFTMDVPLNDLTKAGPFNATDNALQLVFSMQDKALKADGTPLPHSATTTPTDLNVTRLWWSLAAPQTTVSGLAIHPDGDVIATGATTAAVDTVFAFYKDGPLDTLPGAGIHWQKGLNWYAAASHLGSIEAAPAIGAGTATAKIYVATAGRDLVSIDPAGASVWQCGPGALGIFHASAAIATVALLGAQANCEGAFAGADDMQFYGACPGAVPPACVSKQTSVTNPVSVSPTIFAGTKFYVGTTVRVAQTALDGTGNFVAASRFPATDAGPFTGVVYDGTKFYAAFGAATSSAYAFTSALGTPSWKTDFASATILGIPVVDPAISNGLLINTNEPKLYGLAPTTGAATSLMTPASSSSTPLLGDDTRIYLGLNAGAIVAVNDSGGRLVSWSYPLSKPVNAALTMSCDGTLYAAAGDTVYALVTDAGGLRNSSLWPKYQRDTRNSGNADVATIWGVRTVPGAAGCTP